MLAIIQARLASRRLTRKMLLPINGHPLLWFAWKDCLELFGPANVVIACPATDHPSIANALPYARIHGWSGPETDVLGRLHWAAHLERHDPHDLICRITPDDFPIDPLRERCTLGWLDEQQMIVPEGHAHREHVGFLFPRRVEINENDQYEALKRRLET